MCFFFFSSRRRHTRYIGDWSSDVCSSDLVMPTIAKSVLEHHAEFYWHLGDFRAMYGVDEDMSKRYDSSLPVDEYWRIAWGDFLANQVAPFGLLPVHLGIGNHEVAGN